MRTAIYIKKQQLREDSRWISMCSSLEKAGCEMYYVGSREDLKPDTDMILAIGGDGTFLSAAMVAADSGVPVLGANLGRLGFLAENRWEAVAEAIATGAYSIENRTLLHAGIVPPTGEESIDRWPFALNEVCVHRSGVSMLSIDVTIDGTTLPTYWADGLLVATSSGSTAYSLSVGGPIVLPESKVLIVSPISPHNLNVRPLIVPDTTCIVIKVHSRDPKLMLSVDNRTAVIDSSFEINVSMAQFSLGRVRLDSSHFIDALTGKLFWGEDIRNEIKTL